MTSPYSDLDRPPLRVEALRSALRSEDSFWTRLEVVDETGSTNADVARLARDGAAEGLVLVAEHQSAGKGRVQRTWSAPARSGLTFSVLLRPPPDTRAQWGLLPLLAGLAVATSVERLGGVAAALKWPNDVLVGGRKVAGILAEAVGDAVVVGVGVNVSLRADELPVPAATSLLLAGSDVVDRHTVLRAVLRGLDEGYRAWRAGHRDADTTGLLAAYRRICTTLGREVTVHLPGGETVTGVATDVDRAGRLVVRGADGQVRHLAAGDVVHVR